MNRKLNTAEPQETGTNRNLVMALVVVGVTIVALLVALLFFNIGKINDDGAATPDVQSDSVEAGSGEDAAGDGQRGQGQGQGGQGQGGQGQGGQDEMQVPELGPVDLQQKEIIESQWRLEDADPMALGDLDADLLVQIYYDFRCDYCAMSAVELEPELQSLIDDGTIRVEYHNLPVLGEDSMLAAQGSLAAANQGKFFEYYEYLFQKQYDQTPVTMTEADLTDVAREVGVVELDQFAADLTSDEIISKVQEDYVHGTQNLGITGTPAFIIGYSYIPGSIPFDTFQQVVDAELARPAA